MATSAPLTGSKKREREVDANDTTTNFRNVSACNRCRNRKNRCDQKLPKCTNCEKSNAECVGFDPVSKREIPRSYIYYLETRVHRLEAELDARNIPYPPPQKDFAISDAIKPGINVPFPVQDEDVIAERATRLPASKQQPKLTFQDRDSNAGLNNLVDHIGLVSVRGSSGAQQAPSTGISFAKVVRAAVKKSRGQTTTPPIKGSSKSQASLDADSRGAANRDAFFNLSYKPLVDPAPFPDHELGSHLVNLYFEHANPQIPVLHRGEFMALFERVYAAETRTSRELYMLNIVFAIGSGIIMGSAEQSESLTHAHPSNDNEAPSNKRQRLVGQQYTPEEYHSTAIGHLENFTVSPPTSEGVGDGLEELQAVCLLAGLALLRPVAPGLWYIIGVAVRFSIDLGLHIEDADSTLDIRALYPDGKAQWTRDLRRRLFWCVFCLDRLVSSCVNRPVSVWEGVVSTEFPSMLDDKHITPAGFTLPPNSVEFPSYKFVTEHYLRLRLMQSEILQVFQHRRADKARELSGPSRHRVSDLKSPFLQRFRSFREWRADIDRRLWEWKESAPTQADTGVAFEPLFLDLNYWQAIIMLYRQSLAVPEQLANELSPDTGDDVQSPGAVNQEREEDKQMVFMKVGQAGQSVLKIYRQLHRKFLVNYTYLATHHLYMSGVSFLYAIWHSDLVRSQLTHDDADFTVLAATSVLNDLAEKCPPAGQCRAAFERMWKVTAAKVMRTSGFGTLSTLGAQKLSNTESVSPSAVRPATEDYGMPALARPSRQVPVFDMNLRNLFSSEELETHRRPSLAPPPGAFATQPQSTEGAAQYLAQHFTSPDVPSSMASFQDTNNQHAYQPQQAPSDYRGLDLSFLDDLDGMGSPGDLWASAINGGFEVTSGSGSGGGTGLEPGAAWDDSGAMLDGYFFGKDGNEF